MDTRNDTTLNRCENSRAGRVRGLRRRRLSLQPHAAQTYVAATHILRDHHHGRDILRAITTRTAS